MATYGGTQRGLPQLTLDPVTGELVYDEGNTVEVSPQTQHQYSPMGSLVRGSARYVGLPILAAGTADYLSGLGGGPASGIPSLSTPVSSSVPSWMLGMGAGGSTGAGVASQAPNVAKTVRGLGGGSGAAKWLPLVGDILQGAGKYGKQRAQNQALENWNERQYAEDERARSLVELQKAALDLQQRDFIEQLYKSNVNNAVRGGALQGVQDLNVQAPAGIPMGTVTGGLRPSAIVGREQIGRAMQDRALPQLANPTDIAGAPQQNYGSGNGLGWAWDRPGGGNANFNYQRPEGWTDQSWAQNTEGTVGYRPSIKEVTMRAISESGLNPATATPDQVIAVLKNYGINATSPGPGQIDFGMGEGPIQLQGWKTLGAPRGGTAPRLPALPTIAPSYRAPTSIGKANTAFGLMDLGSTLMPSILSLFGKPPTPALPTITAPNPAATMRGIRF